MVEWEDVDFTDRTGPAKHVTPKIIERPSVQAVLRCCCEVPVVCGAAKFSNKEGDLGVEDTLISVYSQSEYTVNTAMLLT